MEKSREQTLRNIRQNSDWIIGYCNLALDDSGVNEDVVIKRIHDHFDRLETLMLEL